MNQVLLFWLKIEQQQEERNVVGDETEHELTPTNFFIIF